MSLNFTAAHSSRITKPKTKNPLLRRSSSSPFSTFARRKSSSHSASKSKSAAGDANHDELFSETLEDHGLVTTLATNLRLRDVAQQLRYVQEHMFDAIPERAGMNSTRIAEVLNYRRNLPPIVTVAHIYSLSKSPTATEREIAELVQSGIVRKIQMPGRGIGRSGVGECLVLTEQWIQLVNECTALDEATKSKYISTLHAYPTATTIPSTHFTDSEISSLTKTGFLTSATAIVPSSHSSYLRLDSSLARPFAPISTAGSRAAAGSLAAVGGESAIYNAGGGGGSFLNTPDYSYLASLDLTLSTPSTGPYLRLISTARLHLTSLLYKATSKQAPANLLRERWDGALANTERRAGKKGGLESTVSPAKTKKWKLFQGLRFQWILEECVGSGVIEAFDTGSVGLGLRLTG